MIIPDSQVTEWAFGSSAAGVMDPENHNTGSLGRRVRSGQELPTICVCARALVWSDGQKEKGEGGAYMYVYSSRPVYIYIYIYWREEKKTYIYS